MDLKWLEDFVTLARLGHFSKAAAQRYVTQPALSRRIRSLEVWLGTVLFDRTTNPVELTEAGKTFLPHALSIIAETESVKHDIRMLHGGADSAIRIITSHRLSVTLVPRIVAGFLRDNPNTSVAVMPKLDSTEKYGDYASALVTGNTDFLVTYDHESLLFGDEISGSLERMELASDKILPVASAAYAPQLPDDWHTNESVTIQYIGYPQYSFTNKIIRPIIDPLSRRLQKIYESPFTGSILAMLIEGVGMSWLPESVVANELAAGRLKRLTDGGKTAEIRVFIYRRKESTGPVMESFWKHLAPSTKPQTERITDVPNG